MSDDLPAAPARARSNRPAQPHVDDPVAILEFDQPRPRLLTLSAVFWVLSVLAGMAVIAYFVSRMAAVRTLLEAALLEEDPDISDSNLQNAVNGTLAVCLGLLVVSVVLKLILISLMAARRNWARVLLTMLGVITLPMTVIVAQVLTDEGLRTRDWLLSTIVAQAVLVVAGLLTMFPPRANTWFRTRMHVY